MKSAPEYFLCSFRPLAFSKVGREAVARFSLLPFVDASCRREPDFDSDFPAITSLCRGRNFAPRLSIGDSVVYIAKRGRYIGLSVPHWRLVAILKVIVTFKDHASGADWYRARQLPLPSNCMTFGNPPLPLEKTDYFIDDLNRWDARYRLKAKTWGTFHICESLFCDLHDPPAITPERMKSIFGKIPGTQNPPEICREAYLKLHQLAIVGTESDRSQTRVPWDLTYR